MNAPTEVPLCTNSVGVVSDVTGSPGSLTTTTQRSQ